MEDWRKKEWKRHWGDVYEPEFKDRLVKDILRQLDKKGHIGSVVIDVGSGAFPVSEMLRREGRKILEVDAVAPEEVEPRRARFAYDVEKIGEKSFATLKFLKKIADFLGIKEIRSASFEQADNIILSYILNYIDDPDAFLDELGIYLKVGGSFIIFNTPLVGQVEGVDLTKEGAGRDNFSLVDYFRSRGYEIQGVSLPLVEKSSEEQARYNAFTEETYKRYFLRAVKR